MKQKSKAASRVLAKERSQVAARVSKLEHVPSAALAKSIAAEKRGEYTRQEGDGWDNLMKRSGIRK